MPAAILAKRRSRWLVRDEPGQALQIAFPAHVLAPLEHRDRAGTAYDPLPRRLERRRGGRQSKRARRSDSPVAPPADADGGGEKHPAALRLDRVHVEVE